MEMIRKLLVLLIICLGITVCMNPADAAEQQYKKISRDGISDIVDGKYDETIKSFTEYLNENPGDLESMYVLAVAYAQKNDIAKSMEYVKQAVDSGLPFARFIAGPRALLKPLTDSTAFQAYAGKIDSLFVHGPTVGCVTHDSARFWIRTAQEADFLVKLSKSSNLGNSIISQKVRTKKDNDYTAIAMVDGLDPETEYFYSIYINDQKQDGQWSFKTFPKTDEHYRFQVGFGGGAGYTPKYEYMWNTIHSHNPLAFLLLGDNVYIDNPTRPDVQRYCYYRRQSREEFRKFAASTSVFSIWDDHDFTVNDAWGGPEINDPEWKIPVWRLYKNNWNNPAYGGGEAQPGCWYDFSIGDVDFFMLDGRYYRTDPKIDNPLMLGPVQMQWLLKALKQSTGTFKVIASPVPWSYGAKPGSLDPWQGYTAEREQIFSFLEENSIEGVVLISADRHRSDAWKIERENGYTLYEFESSKISNIHTHGIMPGSMFGYNDTCSFGLLTFDTMSSDPTVAYEIYNIDNHLIHKITLKKSQLTHKKRGNK